MSMTKIVLLGSDRGSRCGIDHCDLRSAEKPKTWRDSLLTTSFLKFGAAPLIPEAPSTGALCDRRIADR